MDPNFFKKTAEEENKELKEVKTYCRILHNEEDDLISRLIVYAKDYLEDIFSSTIESCYSEKKKQKEILDETMNSIAVKILTNMLVADKYENRGIESKKEIKSSRCSSIILKIESKILEEADRYNGNR